MPKNEKDEQKTAHMTQHRKLKNKQHESFNWVKRRYFGKYVLPP